MRLSINHSRITGFLTAFAVLATALPLTNTVDNSTYASSVDESGDLDNYQNYISDNPEYLYPDVSGFEIEPNFSMSNITGQTPEYVDEEIPEDSINAHGKLSKARKVHNIFRKKKKPKGYQKSPVIDVISKNTGESKKAIIQKIDKSLKVFSGEAPAVKCKDTKKGFGGLCVNSQNRAVYKNSDRAKHHWFRSYFVPAKSFAAYTITNLIRWQTCTIPWQGVIPDMIYCQLWKWQNSVGDLLFAGFLAIGYQEATGSPFAPAATKILNAHARIGYKMKGYQAVSYSGEVIELNKIPTDFDLKYIFAAYGSADWDSRNATLAIYPGNKASELGFSLISKPWDPAPVQVGVPNPVSELYKYHWKYVLKIDKDQMRYNLDQRSPEEILHKVRKFVETHVQDYILYGGGMLTDQHLMLVKPEDILNDNDGDEGEDVDYDYDGDEIDEDMQIIDQISPGDSDQTLMDLNFNGFILRVTLEEHAEHTIVW